MDITDLVPNVVLEQLRTQVECGSPPEYLSVKGDNMSVKEKLRERRSVACNGPGENGTVMVSFRIECIDDAPAEFRDTVGMVEGDDVVFEDVCMPSSSEFPSKENAQLRLRSVLDADGKLTTSFSVHLTYEGCDIGFEHLPTFGDGDEVEGELSLSHNEVVRNADESMAWVNESHMRDTARYGDSDELNGVHADDEWLEFLWLVGVEGQVTDGLFENKVPPFDFRELLEPEESLGRLMYFGYRYHGWGYSGDQLEADLEELTELHGDGSYLVF